ncbi:hypothetical protein BH11PSE9_BH11PSE9_38840 [soil metagenome]
MPRIAALTAQQTTRDTLIQYYDGVLAPALQNARLAFAAVDAPARAWKADIDALVAPARVEKAGLPPKPKNLNVGNTALMAQQKQLRLNRDGALREMEAFGGRGDSDEAVALWKRVARAEEKFQACDGQVQTNDANYARDLSAWEAGQKSLEPEVAYKQSLATLRGRLVGLIATFNGAVDYDEPITSREEYLNGYGSYVPSHHFFRANVADGTYFYVFEQNQIDVHLHCSTYNGAVELITFKGWGSNENYALRAADTYLGGKRGLTLHSPHLAAGVVDSRFTGLLNHLRKTYPPVDTATPQKVAPPLPRSR